MLIENTHAYTTELPGWKRKIYVRETSANRCEPFVALLKHTKSNTIVAYSIDVMGLMVYLMDQVPVGTGRLPFQNVVLFFKSTSFFPRRRSFFFTTTSYFFTTTSYFFMTTSCLSKPTTSYSNIFFTGDDVISISLDHVTLLERLSAMGVHGIELSWFIDYLSQRVQRVKFRDKVSSWSPVKGAVPQGSALGPLLFLIYVNVMPSLGRLLQFADDTTLICSGDTHDHVQQQLEHDLRLLLFWK